MNLKDCLIKRMKQPKIKITEDLVKFFALLLKVDRRINPRNYKKELK